MNNKSIKNSLSWLPGILVLFIISACSPLTIQEQNELGEEISSDIEKASSLVTDPETIQYINSLAEQFIALPPLTDHSFTFRIIDSNNFNAFAIAGGNIYLTKGVILNCRNVAELVSVMNHEIAHVKLGHIEESYRPNNVAKIIADFTGITLAIATANPFLIGIGDITANLGSSVYVTSHSRNSEREADELAFQMMIDTGYDVRSQLTIFTRLQIANNGEGQIPFLQTHPLPEERVYATRQRLEQIQDYRPKIISDEGRLQRIQARLSN